MAKRRLFTLGGLTVALLCGQSSQPTLNPRDLFFQADPYNDGSAQAGPSTPAAPEQLGIRYSLVKRVNREAQTYQYVSQSTVFRNGECFAFELETNRAGNLFVLAEGPSREWIALYPLEAEQTNRTSPGRQVRVPAKGCIEFMSPAGVERLFLVLLQENANVDELVKAFRSSDLARDADHQQQTQTALGSRDLRLATFDEPIASNERRFTTYAVAKPPRLFVEVRLTHE